MTADIEKFLRPLPLLPVLGHEVPLYRTDGMSREEWLERRQTAKKIGASHVAAIMQRHPYSSALQVATALKGLAPTAFGPEEMFRMELGTVCESQIRRLAANKLEVPIIQPGQSLPSYITTWPQVLQHPTIDCLTCNLDGVVVLGSEALVLECKWTSYRNKPAWRALADSMDVGATLGTSVFAYYIQVQTQLAITGLKRGILIGIIGEDAACRMLMNLVQGRTGDESFDPRSYDIVSVTIERNEDDIASIEKVVPRFHQRFILGPDLPEPQLAGDLEALRDAWRAAHPPKPVEQRPDLDDLCRRYMGILNELRKGEKLRDQRKAEILHALTQSKIDGFETGGHRVTYKANVKGIRSVRVSQKEGE